jgi:hypothetical protein
VNFRKCFQVEIDDELVCTVMLSAIPAAMLVYALLEALYFVRSLNALVTPFFSEQTLNNFIHAN